MKTKLKRVARLVAGGTPTVDDEKNWATADSGLPWVSIGDMSDGRPVESTTRHVSNAGVESKRLPIGEAGTLLFAMYASVGAVGTLGVRASWNQALLGIEAIPGTSDPRFIRYWLEHLKPDLAALSRSNTQDNLNAEQVGNFPFPVMQLAEQRAIADYLDAETARIDALITKKQQLIHLLEERWRALVDHTTSVGLSVRVRHITSLRTSGPRGWADRVGDLGQPFIRSGNLTRDTISLDTSDLARVTPPELAEARRSSTELGDTLVGITGANTGWVASVDDPWANSYVSQHVAILRPSRCEPRWLTYSLFAPRSQDQLLGGQYGGTKTQLGLQDLAELEVSVPSTDEQQRLIQRLDSERRTRVRLVESVNSQISLMQERRQALITAAVSR